ncbi:MAG TPA: hypothetical protein VGG10_08395 [Rhizomicrobium sp.]|jgi:hypothetical protein
MPSKPKRSDPDLKAAEAIMERLVQMPPQSHKDVPSKSQASKEPQSRQQQRKPKRA